MYLYYGSEFVFSTSVQGSYFSLPCVVINWLSSGPLDCKLSEDLNVNLHHMGKKNEWMCGLFENLSGSFKNNSHGLCLSSTYFMPNPELRSS